MRKLLFTLAMSIALITSAACIATELKTGSVSETVAEQGEEQTETETERYYTVTFDVGGGTEIASQRVREGERVDKPEDPIKIAAGDTTYTFKGWYVGEEEYDFGRAVTSDLIITAKWDSVEYGGANPIRK